MGDGHVGRAKLQKLDYIKKFRKKMITSDITPKTTAKGVKRLNMLTIHAVGCAKY